MLTPRRAVLGVVAAVLVALSACSAEADGPAAAPAPDPAPTSLPTVVVTLNLLADIVETAFDGLAEVVDVMPPGVDPHSFELSAAGAEALFDADLIVVNGLGLEENVLPVVAGAEADGVPVLEIAPLLDPLPYGDAAMDGDDPTMLDPHVFTDVARMAEVPRLVVEALIDATGPTASAVEELRVAAEAATEDLLALDAEVEQLLSVVPEERRVLVTNHHVFGYLADRYGFRVLGAVIPGATTLASPSAADLADLAAVIEQARVPVLFADASSPTQLVDALADTVELEVSVVSLWTESLSPPGEGAETYPEMMRANARSIADALTP